MPVLTVHIDHGTFKIAKTDDPALVDVEVVAIVDGRPTGSSRPFLEREIIRFVGDAREYSALMMAKRALEDHFAHRINTSNLSSLHQAMAMWDAIKSETEHRLQAAQRVLYGGPTQATSASAFSSPIDTLPSSITAPPSQLPN